MDLGLTAYGRGVVRHTSTKASRLPGSRIAEHAGVRELGAFALAYLVYFGVRAFNEGSAPEAVANALKLIRFERDLGIAWEGALQEAVMGTRALVDAANAVYMYGHWPVIILTGLLLFRYRRAQYFRLRDACLISGLVGLVIFGLFPVAPPRLTDLPLVDTITRDDAGYRQIIPPSLVNEYAAMPSFHAGWNVLLGVVVFEATRHWLLRALAVVVPSAMVVAVIVTANHFVVDVVAGVGIVLACLWARDHVHARAVGPPNMGSRVRSTRVSGTRRPVDGAVSDRAPRRQRSGAAEGGSRARRPARRG